MSTSLVIIGRQFGIYAGLSIFTFGIIGNLINLCVLFSTRSNPCLFLLFVSSIFNIITLSVGLLPRVLNIGFGIDALPTSMLWCKSRYFLSYIATITSLTCICFASIDRYFVSCRSVTWRNWSKISTAKITALIAILIIIAINIPYLIFSTIIETRTSTNSTMTVCSLINPSLDLYIDYFVRPILIGILPAIILSVMGSLTYCNIMSITNVQRRGTFQRGLTSMILLQIITIVIPIAPFATMNIYQTITSSSVFNRNSK